MLKLEGKAGGILVETSAAPLVLVPLSIGGKHGDGNLKYALINAADYPLIQHGKWRARWDGTTRTFYAGRTVKFRGRRTEEQIHRVVLGLEFGDTKQGDHLSGATLDNRRSNLRISTPAQNSYNRRRRSSNTSGFKGVFLDHGRWRASIRRGKLIHLGMFDTAAEAAAAYDKAARELHGEFASANA